MNADQLHDWTPIRVYRQEHQSMVDWCYMGDARFTEPFFEETIQRRFYHPFNVLFRRQTPVEVLADLQDQDPGVGPTGFIFHMSRCGSTLVSQMLAALPQNIVISEAGPIDAVLRSHWRDPQITDAERTTWLRGLINAFGRKRDGSEKHLFIKFDSWHAMSMDLIQRAFPKVPWIFLYRNPIEVMASHRRMPGAQMLPGDLHPGLLGIPPGALGQMPLDEYCARVLAGICAGALGHANSAGRFIDYRKLPQIVWSELLDHFHVEFSPAEVDRMRAVTQYDAKTPSLFFADDTAAKRREATDEMRRLADEWVMPFYIQLEAMGHAGKPDESKSRREPAHPVPAL